MRTHTHTRKHTQTERERERDKQRQRENRTELIKLLKVEEVVLRADLKVSIY